METKTFITVLDWLLDNTTFAEAILRSNCRTQREEAAISR